MHFDPNRFLLDTYPERSKFFRKVGKIDLLKRKNVPVPIAVARTVVGQMLSGAAARAIYAKLEDATDHQNLPGVWHLNEASLRACGLSGGKTRTIIEFSESYSKNAATIDSWPELSFEVFSTNICAYWGISDWTASIISLSYFGNEDVFPTADGSVQRALKMIDYQFPSQHRRRPGDLNPSRSQPYRSYLALALWKGIDEGVLA
jgi:DNA-3-methyladenine glycosylase II